MTKRVFLSLLKIFALTGLFVPLAFAADSAKIISRANDLYKKEKYEDARKLYEEALAVKPDMPALNFNAGAAQFKTGEYGKAAGSFEKGLLHIRDEFVDDAAHAFSRGFGSQCETCAAPVAQFIHQIH